MHRNSRLKSPTAAIVSIGNELLSGKVQDSNTPFLIKHLRELGVQVRCVVSLPDEIPVISQVISRLSPRFTFVFTSGGIGPTHDDVTVEAVAKAFHQPLVRQTKMARGLRAFYKEHTTEAVLKMADLPRGAKLLEDRHFPVPVIVVKNVHILPGDPHFFRNKFLSIKKRFRSEPFQLRKIFTLADEGDIADLLKSTESQFPGVSIGSYPRYDAQSDYRVMVTVESKDQRLVTAAARHLQKNLPTKSILRVE